MLQYAWGVYSAMSVMSAPGGLLAGGLGGGGVSRAEPVLLVSDSPVPKIPPTFHESLLSSVISSMMFNKLQSIFYVYGVIAKNSPPMGRESS